MNLKYLILTLAMCISCNSNNIMTDDKAKGIALASVVGGYYISEADRFTFSRFDYAGDTVHKEIKYDDQLYAVNTYAITSQGDTSDLKFGFCTVYYPDGKVQSKGSYAIGKYVQCCAGGPCMMYYDYKIGYWSNYHSNGKLKSKGKYELSPTKIQTSCEGGAIYLESHRNEEWEFYDIDGKRIKAEDGEQSGHK